LDLVAEYLKIKSATFYSWSFDREEGGSGGILSRPRRTTWRNW
jgi:hypothetical protein